MEHSDSMATVRYKAQRPLSQISKERDEGAFNVISLFWVQHDMGKEGQISVISCAGMAP